MKNVSYKAVYLRVNIPFTSHRVQKARWFSWLGRCHELLLLIDSATFPIFHNIDRKLKWTEPDSWCLKAIGEFYPRLKTNLDRSHTAFPTPTVPLLYTKYKKWQYFAAVVIYRHLRIIVYYCKLWFTRDWLLFEMIFFRVLYCSNKAF